MPQKAIQRRAAASPTRGRSATPARKSRDASASPRRLAKDAPAPAPAAAARRRPSTASTVDKNENHEPAAVVAPRTRPVVHIPVLNPRSTEYEFMGPYVGPIGIIIGLPLLVWASARYCGPAGWPQTPAYWSACTEGAWGSQCARAVAAEMYASFSMEAFLYFSAWWVFQAVLHVIVPGPDVPGTLLRDGSRLTYRINGWRCLLITAAVCTAAHASGVPFLPWIVAHVTELATASVVFSLLLSVYLYASSFVNDPLLALGGNSGIALYDFFIGRELNPRVMHGRIDLKFFCELRPGLFGWLLINTAFLHHALTVGAYADKSLDQALGLIAVYALQALYVADSVYCEECILTTIDIIQDGFGFMLAFGDLAWVPFTYSFQMRYLADNNPGFSPVVNLAFAAVGVAGFYIFRAANAQKDTFRTNPDHPSVKDLKFIQTRTGSRLLADGWWAVSRHINYFGDWLLSVGMSLPTGFATPITYFYPAYFAVLLIHREMRDEHKCSHKYGEEWQEYKRRVPYRIIPGVY